MLQTPSTGVANWPSKATSLMGEMVSINEWKRLTKSYRKISENIQWAVRNEQESFRLAVDALKGSSTELHASLRMNLFEGGDLGKLFNGKFWFEHPRCANQTACNSTTPSRSPHLYHRHSDGTGEQLRRERR